MVNVPPPLLCHTPPPLDFGEEDEEEDSGLQSTLQLEDADPDEYSDYGFVSDTLNAKEYSISATETLPPDPKINGYVKTAATAEAFNYQVKAPDYDLANDEQQIEDVQDQQEVAQGEEQANKQEEAQTEKQEEAQAEKQEEQHQVEQEEKHAEVLADEDQEEEEATTNDNVPSLNLDSLSLYSSESISPSCKLSPVADEQATAKTATIVHQATLEDVSDDSDEECSPKKPKELFIQEGAVDFFAIEIVNTSETSRPIPDAQQTFATFQEEAPVQQELNEYVAAEKLDEEEDDFGDFGDFADFSAAPAAMESAASIDDVFDDFQDFATPSTVATAPPKTVPIVADDDDDDDDFGDFAEPAFVSAPATVATVASVLPQPPPPAAAHLSITERVKPVLELMFPTLEASSAQLAAKQTTLAQTQALHFGAIEQAHALDYQWASSEMRHSLVRSLAIDSRNILFGDKWNASMPRFAANLSFDPLKPLKPLSAASSMSSSIVLDPQQASISSWRPTNSSSTQQPLQGLETAAAAAATQTSQAKAEPGTPHGQGATHGTDASAAVALDDDAAAAASVFTAATTAAPLSPALSADGNGHNFDDGEQLAEQQPQQLDLRKSPSPSPTPSPSPPPPAPISSHQLHEITNSSSNNSSNSFAMPLKETHIYTPSKSDTAVAKTTTLPPIDFDYEIASAGIIIDETVVKKEYRDVEYKPPAYPLDSPSKLNASGKPAPEDDDFSDFQSVVAVKSCAQLQPPRNGTPTFGEQMILSPAILLPQSIPLAKPSIEWGDNALASINADEMARIEELFSHQYKPPTISATVAQQSPKQQQQHQQQEDDEWSDFVSVPVQQQQQQQSKHHNHNNNVLNLQKSLHAAAAANVAPKEDDWSDFVSSNPLPAHSAPQYTSGAWHSANFYNNPLSLYQQQQQPHAHSKLPPKYQSNNSSKHSSNKKNNNAPQQIHMMHDFSTVPTATAATAPATYQHQHHQHHQKQLQQQQQQHHRQQFHLGNAKVAPRISLIPDMSFASPALPTNAGSFMSSLPKPSFSAKK